jgi:hypothetical protein
MGPARRGRGGWGDAAEVATTGSPVADAREGGDSCACEFCKEVRKIKTSKHGTRVRGRMRNWE